MTVQCRDRFEPYQPTNMINNFNNNENVLNLFITLVESQKTKQGVSLCKRTLTYLKSLCIGSHWIVDASSWLTECISKGYVVKPDAFEIGGSIHDTHIRGPSRSRLCIRDSNVI